MLTKKLFILVIASALILPGAIYADLMVTGYMNEGSQQVTDAITLMLGPNYANASKAGLFKFVPDKQNLSGNLGSITLFGSQFQNIELLNVLSITLGNNLVNGTLYLSISNSNFTHGLMVFGSTQLNSSDLLNPGSYDNMRSINLTGGAANFSIVSSGVLYIGFYLPSGFYAGSHLTITANYIKL